MLALALGSLLLQTNPGDPPAFRAVFEDRPRQLIVRCGGTSEQDGLLYVFSPDTCSIRKVWWGNVVYRGKVYDFSQENSYGEGKVIFEVPSEIIDNSAFPGRGAGELVWTFDAAGDRLESQGFSIGAWGPIYLAFEEKGDTDSLHINVTRPDRSTEIGYLSSNTVLGPNVWQWNYKQIPHDVNEVRTGYRITFEAKTLRAPKQLRRIRLFGDRMAWFNKEGKPMPVRFLGYTIRAGETNVSCLVGGVQVDLLVNDLSSAIGPGHFRIRYRILGAEKFEPLTLRTYQSDSPPAELSPGSQNVPFENDITFTSPGDYVFTRMTQ
ncbi:MAG: hypothetical protein KF812_09560 [Fimbriimonadaceae bacterium]|nr:hypothetical protein [Fimbriimonadaceae bacterium]